MVPLEGQVGLAKLCVSDHEHEYAFLVDRDEDFRQREAIYAGLKNFLEVALCLCMHLKRLKPVIEVVADKLVDHADLGFFICLHHILLFLL